LACFLSEKYRLNNLKFILFGPRKNFQFLTTTIESCTYPVMLEGLSTVALTMTTDTH